mgnify:CR=1 FL=1
MSYDNELMNAIKMLIGSVKEMQTTIEQLSRNDYAVECALNNIKWELFANEYVNGEKIVYPQIEPIDDTISKIINNKMSMSRFGDGEFSIINGKSRQGFQREQPLLAERLLQVFRSKDNNHIVCIPDMYGDLSMYNTDGRYNIRLYLTSEIRKQHYELMDMNRIYGNTHITRPYVIYADNNTDAPIKRFQKLRKIWDNRKLLIIEGEKTRMGVGNDLFDNAIDIVRILGPAIDAFDRYDDILHEALQQDKDRLVLIALGATATVLAYDLSREGFQALDIGHIDIEYEWMLAGKGERTEIKHKFNNEVEGGNVVYDIDAPEYEKQIIAKYLNGRL